MNHKIVCTECGVAVEDSSNVGRSTCSNRCRIRKSRRLRREHLSRVLAMIEDSRVDRSVAAAELNKIIVQQGNPW